MMLALLIALLVISIVALLGWWRATHPADDWREEGICAGEDSPTITITSKTDGQIVCQMSMKQLDLFNQIDGGGCIICRGRLLDTVANLAPGHSRWGAVLAHPRCMQGLHATVTP